MVSTTVTLVKSSDEIDVMALFCKELNWYSRKLVIKYMYDNSSTAQDKKVSSAIHGCEQGCFGKESTIHSRHCVVVEVSTANITWLDNSNNYYEFYSYYSYSY